MPQTKNNRYLLQHCTCVNFSLDKKGFKKLQRLLKRILKEPKEKIETPIPKGTAIFSGETSLSTSMIEEDRRRLKVQMHILGEIKRTVDEAKKKIKEEQKCYDLLKQFKPVDVNAISCTTFLLEGKKYVPVGGFVLPRRIDLKEEKMGVVQIEGLRLAFEKSPIGLFGASLDMHDGNLHLGIALEYKLSSTDDFLVKSLILAHDTVDLFVVKK